MNGALSAIAVSIMRRHFATRSGISQDKRGKWFRAAQPQRAYRPAKWHRDASITCIRLQLREELAGKLRFQKMFAEGSSEKKITLKHDHVRDYKNTSSKLVCQGS